MDNAFEIRNSGSMKVVWFFVNLAYYLGWGAAALLVAMIIAMSVFDFQVMYSQLPVEVSYDNTGYDYESPINPNSVVPVTGFQRPRVRAENLPGLEYVMLFPTILLIGYLWLLMLLRQFLKIVRDGRPFDPGNPALLRKIGWLITAAGPAYGFFNYIYGKLYVSMLDIPHAYLEPEKEIYAGVIFAGLVIVVIAQVLDLAVRLKYEQELTI